VTILRALIAAACYLWCRATLAALHPLRDFDAYAWYEGRAALHRRTIERLLEPR
jgi:hypothetical protein